MKKRFSEEQIIGFLREADAGMPIKELCRRHGFSEASYRKLPRPADTAKVELTALMAVGFSCQRQGINHAADRDFRAFHVESSCLILGQYPAVASHGPRGNTVQFIRIDKRQQQPCRSPRDPSRVQ